MSGWVYLACCWCLVGAFIRRAVRPAQPANDMLLLLDVGMLSVGWMIGALWSSPAMTLRTSLGTLLVLLGI